MLNEINKNNLSGLRQEDFQRTIDGKQTDLFILTNKKGCEVALTNYGGALCTIMVPDKDGKMGNVVQGHDSIEHVVNSHEPFLSTLIGRYGNRICKGRFTLDGKEYKLAINNGPNHLHGGPTGFHARVWDAEKTADNSVTLHRVSPDGEEGFPGTLDVTVTYTFTDDNELVIDYRATTDKKTIVNLTHHGFFSLSGLQKDTASVERYVLTLNADHYVPIDDTSIPLGSIDSVEGTPFDFRTPHVVGERIDADDVQTRNGAGYDHCWVLNKREPGELSFAAKCVDPVSGRCMEVYTTEPGVQIYTSNWHNGFEGWKGATFPKRSAICFEAQHFPDSPNRAYFPSVVLKPGEVYTQTTVFKFSVEE